ncbi:ABC transporter substrate-binding protein [Aurantimonas sp. MSK8Z-1]|uniref:ABC transporter substrate-binding protein n=1 Tax=Mangrovibrevibacter kandeliae TaxID=2968473 RepID=UPI0021186A39|nr:ABC transporter substrate-binding protein [Aurantimonas sp. MSK8Z-1]MCW4114109.1 ABC transporter substrate-binding protein [Aurantimonas sp. MSK8Z-1]
MTKLRWMALAFGLLASSTASAQTLRIALQDDPDMLDPHKARTFVGRIVFTSLCDKLVDISPDLNFVPQLATEWSWNEAQTELTFKLRDGVTFQDGSTFDADAVKANIERAMTLKDSNRKSELSSVDHVEAVDPSTVKFVLKQPDATLLATLSDRAGMMLAPDAFADGKEFSQNPVCSGPYKYVNRVQNDRIELTKYDGYWNAKDYPIEAVTFVAIPDNTVKLANLRSGDVDMIERVAPSDIPSVKQDSKLTLVPVTGLGYMGIEFNVANGEPSKLPINADKRVREALQYAVGRDIIDQVVGNGTFPPAQQPFPPSSPYHSDKFPVVERDVDKAKALLKEAGVENPTFTLGYANNTTTQQVAELMQAMAAEAGFTINLQPQEFAALQADLQQGKFEVSIQGWSGRVDPDGNIHQFVTCKGNLNDGKYCNADVDKALNAARQTSDPEKRKALYDEAQTILQDDLPWLYSYYLPWPFVVSDKVKGFKAYPDGMIRLKGMTLSQ